MRPEARCLLKIRKEWGLLLNFRPMIYYKDLAHLAMVKEETIPADGIEQHFIRFLLEDSYFGTEDMFESTIRSPRTHEVLLMLGIKEKSEVRGNEKSVVELSYYQQATVKKYFRCAFQYAKDKNLPLISIDKANVMARYKFWRDIATKIGKDEFPDVELRHQLVDSANALLFTPAKLHGVIACGNEHGDILSDGAAAAMGSMGMMCSSAINPDNGMAMFESGAGTAPTLKNQNRANPIGRILTGEMMLRHIGATNGADAIGAAVKKVLFAGWRTEDIARKNDPSEKILGTKAIGAKILENL
jgi:3-isopropylmalate dehydrogenase